MMGAAAKRMRTSSKKVKNRYPQQGTKTVKKVNDMKSGIHPTYHEKATIVCSCGNEITTGSTLESLRVDLCSKCHPFYTGQQKLVDTEGQVDRFMQRLRRSKRLQD